MLVANTNFNKQKSFPEKLSDEHTGYTRVVWAVIGLGILLRLFHFFYNRSFWVDETYLSNSLIRMNFVELAMGPLEYEQKAPIGYLWVVKCFVLLLGKTEMPLRLFSLIGGIASLFIFLPVARHFLKASGVLLAMAMLAFAPYLIYHAVEAKQYSLDLLATIIAFHLYIRFHLRTDIASLLLWGLWGALLLWFSYSAIFILAGMAIGLSLYYLFKRDWVFFFRSILPFSMWMISFLVNYILFTHKHAGSGWLEDWFRFRDSFMPLPPVSKEGVIWFFKAIYTMFRYPLGLTWFESEHPNDFIKVFIRVPLMPLLLAMLAIGTVIFYKTQKKFFWVLLFPILLVIIASGFELYPFYERTVVFLAPLFILLLVVGTEKLTGLLRLKGRWQYILPVLLIIGPLGRTVIEVARPQLFGQYKNTTIREAFFHVKEHIKPGDVVYVYWNFHHHYRYYQEAYKLNYGKVLEGKDMRYLAGDSTQYVKNLEAEIKQITGTSRIWLLYDKRHREAIGDQLGQPAWYFGQQRPSNMVYNIFSSLGKEEKNSFDSGGLGIIPFKISTNKR